VPLPEGCVLDGHGRPTTDPKAFYGPPPGAILPLGGHKGYALSFLVEMLAGALTGGGCSNPEVKRVANNMLTVVLDPTFFQASAEFSAEIERFTAWVKSSATAAPGGEVLVPGEVEARTRARRLREGIDLDETTWGQLQATRRLVGLSGE
jgi:hydroxycarboxylate dehydrogenase B